MTKTDAEAVLAGAVDKWDRSYVALTKGAGSANAVRKEFALVAAALAAYRSAEPSEDRRLEDALARIRELEGALEKAPHMPWCQGSVGNFEACTCWKKALLSGGGAFSSPLRSPGEDGHSPMMVGGVRLSADDYSNPREVCSKCGENWPCAKEKP